MLLALVAVVGLGNRTPAPLGNFAFAKAEHEYGRESAVGSRAAIADSRKGFRNETIQHVTLVAAFVRAALSVARYCNCKMALVPTSATAEQVADHAAGKAVEAAFEGTGSEVESSA